jgi:hypothetical protein
MRQIFRNGHPYEHRGDLPRHFSGAGKRFHDSF